MLIPYTVVGTGPDQEPFVEQVMARSVEEAIAVVLANHPRDGDGGEEAQSVAVFEGYLYDLREGWARVGS
jgi:hypothetical protein